jgi:hypothetical protein
MSVSGKRTERAGSYRNYPMTFNSDTQGYLLRTRSRKRFRSPGIDSKESIPPTYVAWRAGTSKRVVAPARRAGNRFLGLLKGLQIRAQVC